IQSWSESPGDTDTLDVLLRNLHTLKGGARMAGLNSLGEYAHNFETFLIGIQQNPVELDDDFFALLNKRQDEVIRRVEIYKRLSVGAASDEDLASLRQALEPTLETVPAQDDESGQPAQEVGEAKSRPAPAGDKQAVSASQEMIRVSADLLEELISMAGESSITRGRIEQQITDFGEALQEMEETINRIREQVRRLEIEAESRETLIRSRAEADSGDFDELEMDRYTMLQATSRALNEATSDMMDLKDTLVNRSRDAETLLHQQARISGELQEGLTRTSMVPFARLIPRLRRIVRQVSGEVGKSVRFDAYNVEGELDRNVLEKIVAPLEHMLRNAVDHGIEEKEKRLQVGKPEQGRISLRLSREGGYVVLTISDDGGGINVDAVRSKAIERGLMSAKQPLSDHDIMQFILHAGFSTAQKLTQISGRGVGMDVVVSEIKALGGSITIDSTLGVGTEFTIRIPFTVSINRALMVIVREETYAVPLNTIEGIVRVSPYELEAYYQPDAPMFEYAGQPYRLGYMGKMLDMGGDDPNLSGQVAPLPVILARSGDHAVALQVDRVVGSREVVVKTLGAQFADVGGISGATVLGDGSVVIILDCMALVRSYEAQRDAGAALMETEPAPEPAASVRTVMIVDDSVTVRKVTSRLMERNGYEVETAKDGVDAMNQLQEIRPDVMLLDIEMPRMDGFEVLRSVRRDEAIKDLPIIMITSRTGEKHKQQAMELGVNGYLGKPFQEANLLATIEEVIENAKKAGSTQE
ncbi:MAG: response regulator, partial [Proteobacteria bacterium]|nr:response regulator [Pseudomonadota bacterium]